MSNSTQTTHEARFTSPQLRNAGYGVLASLSALLSIYNMTGTIQFAPVSIGVGAGCGLIVMYGIERYNSSNYLMNIEGTAEVLGMIVVIGVGALLLAGVFLWLSVPAYHAANWLLGMGVSFAIISFILFAADW